MKVFFLFFYELRSGIKALFLYSTKLIFFSIFYLCEHSSFFFTFLLCFTLRRVLM